MIKTSLKEDNDSGVGDDSEGSHDGEESEDDEEGGYCSHELTRAWRKAVLNIAKLPNLNFQNA